MKVDWRAVSHLAAAIVGQVVPGVQMVESIAWQFGSLHGKDKQDAVVALVQQSLAAAEGITARRTWPTISTSSTRREPSPTRSSRCTRSSRAKAAPASDHAGQTRCPRARQSRGALDARRRRAVAEEAQAAVDAVVATNSVVRVVVAQVMRSFVTTAQATEDAIATVDP
jgi:hypothetical protein